MKLQNLVIIFIIIIIPIVSIFALYLNLETKTIALQTDYDAKLIEATKEAMSAFEINTTEWNSEFSSLANSKRDDLLATTNVFISSMADKLRIGGSSKESILTYVPAIVFTMYDGYYIYAPTYLPQTITDNNGVQLFYYEASGSNGSKITNSATQNIGGTIYSGEPMYVGTEKNGEYNGKSFSFTTNITNAEKTYKHILKTFVPYTTTFDKYVINYTLDNYIRIYGENIKKEGYIIENFYSGGSFIITMQANSISDIKFDGKEIKPEILTENVPVKNPVNAEVIVEQYTYIYNSNGDKRYYDSDLEKYFTINKNYVRVDLPETTVGTNIAEYKKVLVWDNNKVIELYQLLNGTDNNWYYIESPGKYKEYTQADDSIKYLGKPYDCSAINYYVEAYDFNKWLVTNAITLGLNNNKIQEIINNKNQNIIDNINENLNLSFSNYSANSGIDFKLPKLTEADWEQALSNVSIITFFQGSNIGLKIYNNYAVVSSTQNNEYVSEDSLYFRDSNDQYYHRYGCSSAKDTIGNAGVYKNTEFIAKNYTYKIAGQNDFSGFYYKHVGNTGYSIQQCFDCIVNRNNFDKDTTNYTQSFYTALARERYIQMQRTKLIK